LACICKTLTHCWSYIHSKVKIQHLRRVFDFYTRRRSLSLQQRIRSSLLQACSLKMMWHSSSVSSSKMLLHSILHADHVRSWDTRFNHIKNWKSRHKNRRSIEAYDISNRSASYRAQSYDQNKLSFDSIASQMTASQVKNRKSKSFAFTQAKIDGETRVHQRRRKNHQFRQ